MRAPQPADGKQHTDTNVASGIPAAQKWDSIVKAVGTVPHALRRVTLFPPGWEARLHGMQGCLTPRRTLLAVLCLGVRSWLLELCLQSEMEPLAFGSNGLSGQFVQSGFRGRQ
jgi:hypothetical protein